MKKLFMFLATVALTAMGANVFAQGSGVSPQIGSAHNYWVNASESEGVITHESGIGNYYRWWISEIDNLHAPLTAGTEFTVISGEYNGEGEDNLDNFSIQLNWKPASAGKTYYLIVEETDAEGCANLKAVAIQPVNAFDVIFAAIDDKGSDSDNPAHCAPDILLSASGTTITYNYGLGEYLYKISSIGLHSAWQFNYEFSNSLVNGTAEIEFSEDGAAYTSIAVSGSKTITPVNGIKTVYFKVKVNNGNVSVEGDEKTGQHEEGLSGQSIVLTLTNISDGVNAPANIYMSNGATLYGEDEDIEQMHTVKARPATSGIGYN